VISVNIIPDKLKNYRFIRTKEKLPIDPEWTVKNNFSFDEMNKILLTEHRTTYGVLTGVNNLYVVDFDNIFLQEDIIKQYPFFLDTFVVKTATKGLYHCYFKSITEPRTMAINDENDIRIVDILAKGKQVIGANSILSTGKKYEIISDKEIKELDFIKIEEIFTKIKQKIIRFDKKESSSVLEKKELNHWVFPIENKRDTDLIKNKLKLSYFLKYLNLIEDENQERGNCNCPFHSSVSGKCFSYDNEKKVWYCFHCGKNGDIISLYKGLPENKYKNFKYILKELAMMCNIDLYEDRKLEEKKLKKQVLYEKVKEKKENAVLVYENLAINKITIFKKKDESFTEFFFETFNIKIEVKDLLNSNMFRQLYFSETGTMLPSLSSNEWSELLSKWIEKSGDLNNDFYVDDSLSILRERMLDVINDFVIIENKEESLGINKILYLKEFSDSIFINVQALNEVLLRNNFNSRKYKTSMVFKNDLKDNSKIINIKNRQYRYYEFSKNIISNFKINNIKETGELTDDFDLEE